MTNHLLCLALSLLFSSHDVHITHTTLYYNSNVESIEITMKVAIEDLERSLEGANSKKLRLGTIRENKSAKKIIMNYFSKHLRIYTNDELSQYQWIGKEIDRNLHDIYLYFEIINCNQNGIINSLTIENSIFLEKELHQTNIVIIEFKGSSFNLTFTKDQDIHRIQLSK
jgi:hypothetical protein